MDLNRLFPNKKASEGLRSDKVAPGVEGLRSDKVAPGVEGLRSDTVAAGAAA